MITKFKLEDVFNVAGSIAICGPIMEGNITLKSVVLIGGVKVGIKRMDHLPSMNLSTQLFRKFVDKAIKGDNIGIFLEKGPITLEIVKSLTYKKTNRLIDIIDVCELRSERLKELGI